jgi:hypothetical protein
VKYREVVARLKQFGVAEYSARGKGSERLLVRETMPGSGKGPQYTLKCHGEGKEVAKGTLRATGEGGRGRKHSGPPGGDKLPPR